MYTAVLCCILYMIQYCTVRTVKPEGKRAQKWRFYNYSTVQYRRVCTVYSMLQIWVWYTACILSYSTVYHKREFCCATAQLWLSKITRNGLLASFTSQPIVHLSLCTPNIVLIDWWTPIRWTTTAELSWTMGKGFFIALRRGL